MSDIINIRMKAESSARREIYKKITSRCKDLPRSLHVTAQEFISICNQSDISLRAHVAAWAPSDTRVVVPNPQGLELVEKLLNAIDIIEKRDKQNAQLRDENNTLRRKLAIERIRNDEILKKIGTMNHVH